MIFKSTKVINEIQRDKLIMMLFSAFGYRKKKKIFNVELREGKGKERDIFCLV